MVELLILLFALGQGHQVQPAFVLLLSISFIRQFQLELQLFNPPVAVFNLLFVVFHNCVLELQFVFQFVHPGFEPFFLFCGDGRYL